jgi:hypothetical protein
MTPGAADRRAEPAFDYMGTADMNYLTAIDEEIARLRERIAQLERTRC